MRVHEGDGERHQTVRNREKKRQTKDMEGERGEKGKGQVKIQSKYEK